MVNWHQGHATSFYTFPILETSWDCLISPWPHFQLMLQLWRTVLSRTDGQGLPLLLPAFQRQQPAVPIGVCSANVQIQVESAEALTPNETTNGQWRGSQRTSTSSFGPSGGQLWDTHQKVSQKDWNPVLKVVAHTITHPSILFPLP